MDLLIICEAAEQRGGGMKGEGVGQLPSGWVCSGQTGTGKTHTMMGGLDLWDLDAKQLIESDAAAVRGRCLSQHGSSHRDRQHMCIYRQEV